MISARPNVVFVFSDLAAKDLADRNPVRWSTKETGEPQLGDYIKLRGSDVELQVVKRVWAVTDGIAQLQLHLQ